MGLGCAFLCWASTWGLFSYVLIIGHGFRSRDKKLVRKGTNLLSGDQHKSGVTWFLRVHEWVIHSNGRRASSKQAHCNVKEMGNEMLAHTWLPFCLHAWIIIWSAWLIVCLFVWLLHHHRAMLQPYYIATNHEQPTMVSTYKCPEALVGGCISGRWSCMRAPVPRNIVETSRTKVAQRSHSIFFCLLFLWVVVSWGNLLTSLPTP